MQGARCRTARPGTAPAARLGISDAASLISARTGVMPRVPMMSALVISAPSQCEKSMTSGPATPGKKYLLPPEKPTTSCGNTGPTTSDTSCSTTARLSTTSTGWSSRPLGQLGDPRPRRYARARRRFRAPTIRG